MVFLEGEAQYTVTLLEDIPAIAGVEHSLLNASTLKFPSCRVATAATGRLWRVGHDSPQLRNVTKLSLNDLMTTVGVKHLARKKTASRHRP